MGDFLLGMDMHESYFVTDSNIRQTGIPIPRGHHIHPYQRSEFDSSTPGACPIVPSNSLVSTFEMLSTQATSPQELQRNTFSPMGNSNSPLMFGASMDMDLEVLDVKVEPFEEYVSAGTMGMHPNSRGCFDDCLFDNVNFEELLQTDQMESTTPCLDPQHSSPAAMTAVRPDDVFGKRNYEVPASAPVAFNSPINIPVKNENVEYTTGGPATFPPLGIGWKDPFLSPSMSFRQQVNDSSSKNQFSTSNKTNFFQTSPLQPVQEPTELPNYSNQEPLFSQLEPSTGSTLHELLTTNSSSASPSSQLSPRSNMSPLKNIWSQDIPIGQSVPSDTNYLQANTSAFSRLSSSAPSNDSLEHIWHRREPRQHLISTGSLAEEVCSVSSLSTGGGLLSPIPHDLSIDEEVDSDDDSDNEHYDSDSDNESVQSEEASNLGHKKERHFWQYNVQAKGPKGHRVNILHSETNPYKLGKLMDPVFSPLCSVQGIKHSGKARRGDGNDLTPSPRKLVSIGDELGKLNKKIAEMTPVSELPTTIRSKSRKEKNKLASRACRLKKKAQHEANKIKLFGLEQEHKGLLALVAKMRTELVNKVEMGSQSPYQNAPGYSESLLSFGSPSSDPGLNLQQQITMQIEKSVKKTAKVRVAGHTTEFVNRVIDCCQRGNPNGGLEELALNYFGARISNQEAADPNAIHPNQESDLYT